MKKLLLAFVALSVVALSACNQNKKETAPEKVQTSFHKQFPKVKKVKWEKEGNNLWEAEFVKNKREFSVKFNTEGIWKETEYKIKNSELAPAVQATLDSLFSGYQIKGAEVTGNTERKAYEIELTKGKGGVVAVIDHKGNLLEKKDLEKPKKDEDKD